MYLPITQEKKSQIIVVVVVIFFFLNQGDKYCKPSNFSANAYLLASSSFNGSLFP